MAKQSGDATNAQASRDGEHTRSSPCVQEQLTKANETNAERAGLLWTNLRSARCITDGLPAFGVCQLAGRARRCTPPLALTMGTARATRTKRARVMSHAVNSTHNSLKAITHGEVPTA